MKNSFVLKHALVLTSFSMRTKQPRPGGQKQDQKNGTREPEEVMKGPGKQGPAGQRTKEPTRRSHACLMQINFSYARRNEADGKHSKADRESERKHNGCCRFSFAPYGLLDWHWAAEPALQYTLHPTQVARISHVCPGLAQNTPANAGLFMSLPSG